MAALFDTLDRNRPRNEPGRIPAIAFAILVHAGFFLLLVFGVSWQSRKPEPIVVEMWSALPPVKAAAAVRDPEPEPPKIEPPQPEPPKVEPRPELPQPAKAEIELKEKLVKQRREKVERQERDKREAEAQKKKDDDAKKLAKQKAEVAARKATDDKAKADASSQKKKVVDDWTNRIKALVRSRANVPETVTGKPVVQVRLKLLVNGVVFEGQLAKPSGNRAYDEAVERAIAGIREWPTPTDPDVFRDNREIILNIEYEK